MTEKIAVVNGELKLTKTGIETIETLTEKEVIGKIAEAQTKLDHLNIDRTEAQAEVDKWAARLENLKSAISK